MRLKTRAEALAERVENVIEGVDGKVVVVALCIILLHLLREARGLGAVPMGETSLERILGSLSERICLEHDLKYNNAALPYDLEGMEAAGGSKPQ